MSAANATAPDPESTERPLVSVIIVSWNTADLLARCLAAVRDDETASSMEIIVVDNASTDGTSPSVVGAHSDVRWIQHDENVGFAVANNRALREASGEYILFLNPDAFVEPGAILSLVRVLEANPSFGAVGPQLTDADGTPQLSCQRAPSPVRDWIHLFHLDAVLPGQYYDVRGWSADRTHEVDVIQGACLLVRRDLVEAIGGFHDGYFMYSEEVELCLRIRRAGFKVGWHPMVRAVHLGGASTRFIADQMFLELYRSKAHYYRRNHGPLTIVAFHAVVFMAAVPRVLAFALLPFVSKGSRERIRRTGRRYARLMTTLGSQL